MSQLVYLAAAVIISVVGSLIVYLRHGRPRSIEDNVQEFSRGLNALGATQPSRSSRRTSRSS